GACFPGIGVVSGDQRAVLQDGRADAQIACGDDALAHPDEEQRHSSPLCGRDVEAEVFRTRFRPATVLMLSAAIKRPGHSTRPDKPDKAVFSVPGPIRGSSAALDLKTTASPPGSRLGSRQSHSRAKSLSQ